MFDSIFTFGQAASVLFLVYGAILVLMPARKGAVMTEAPAQEVLRLRHT